MNQRVRCLGLVAERPRDGSRGIDAPVGNDETIVCRGATIEKPPIRCVGVVSFNRVHDRVLYATLPALREGGVQNPTAKHCKPCHAPLSTVAPASADGANAIGYRAAVVSYAQ